MKAIILIVSLIFSLQFQAYSQTISEDTVEFLGAVPLVSIDGYVKNIKDYRSKYVLVDFWGLGCKPCIDNAPKLVSFQEKYADKLAIVGINDSLLMDKMEKFIAQNNINYGIVHVATNDHESYGDEYMRAYNLFSNNEFYGWPFYVLLDKSGKVLKRRTRPHLVEKMFEEGELK